VMIWLRQYRREGDYAFLKKPRKRLKKDDPKAYIAQLEMEVDLLKKFHSELRKERLAKRNTGSFINTEENIE